MVMYFTVIDDSSDLELFAGEIFPLSGINVLVSCNRIGGLCGEGMLGGDNVPGQ
jgi:hypothetical protein